MPTIGVFGRCCGAPGRPLLLGGPSRREILARALALRDRLVRGGGADEPVCLATDDRGDAALARFVSPVGGPPLVIPHDASWEAVDAARNTVPFARAVGEAGRSPAERRAPGSSCGGRRIGSLPPRAGASIGPFVHLHTGGSTGRPQAWAKTPRNPGGSRPARGTSRTGPADRIVATVTPRHIYGLLFSPSSSRWFSARRWRGRHRSSRRRWGGAGATQGDRFW